MIPTVSRCCRSRDGRVEGEKWSFRRTVCLMMLSLFRMAIILESADPDTVSLEDDLKEVEC